MKWYDESELHYFIWDDEEVTKKIELPIEKKATFCQHWWVDYTGLQEVYKYCKYCGEKTK